MRRLFFAVDEGRDLVLFRRGFGRFPDGLYATTEIPTRPSKSGGSLYSTLRGGIRMEGGKLTKKSADLNPRGSTGCATAPCGVSARGKCVGTIQQPRTRREFETWSLPRDVMAPRHDRQFREIPLFLPLVCGNISDMALRIIDIAQSGNSFVSNMHVFGPTADKEISTDVALFVWNGPARFLLPSAETILETWSTWHYCINNV